MMRSVDRSGNGANGAGWAGASADQGAWLTGAPLLRDRRSS